MKTKALNMMGLGLALALLWPVSQSLAAKGGKPGKPKPPPEPPPEQPISYQRVDIEPQPQQLGYTTTSINDLGVIAGTFATSISEDNSEYIVLLPPYVNAEGVVSYRADDVVVVGTNEAYAGYGGLLINNLNQIAGAHITWSDVVFTNDWFPEEPWTNWCHRAVFWNSDGAMSELWNPDANDLSQSCAINDSGLAVIADCEDYDNIEDWSGDNWWNILSSYVVAPDDRNGDGVADTWYADDDGNGINDLAYLIDTLGYQPRAINEYGTVVFSEGVALTPDYDDPDGDGNPWFADGNGDGINDLLKALKPLKDGGTARAGDINDFGEIAGSDWTDWDDRCAVLWANATAPPVDLGKPVDQTEYVSAASINNVGQIVGLFGAKNDYYRNGKWKIALQRSFLFDEGVIYDFRDFVPDHGAGNALNDINDNGWILSAGYVYVPVE
ncbi:hypothetical protein [Pontiella sulfatireligans]|uniref:Uncharacterized protein n=1 Tax=Pontiella sulfatireligans TaxID=2750658 RepID=A0A6C2UHU8_9BACT|nr:hypothetical protein [Pontiella sulfatireligans]VGO19775.1 hypothetical protein SCARR_01834 [Pontiella sulfatireligans]